jgi:hypothetical protein
MRDVEALDREELIRIIPDRQRLIEQRRAEIEQWKRRGSAATFSKGKRRLPTKSSGRNRLGSIFMSRTRENRGPERHPSAPPNL